MCNLYDLDVAAPFLKERFRLRHVAFGDTPRIQRLVRPSDLAPVIHLDADGELVCTLMQWGFVRQWQSPAGKMTMQRLFNVRSETIDSKPSFAPAYRKTRAIIPVSAWFELPEKGVRVRIARTDGSVLALAGLWEHVAHPKTGEPVTAFTMAMTGGNPFTSAYHERMPCLLEDASFKAWLDPQRPDAKKLLMPYPGADLVAGRIPAPASEDRERKPPGDMKPPVRPLIDDLFG